jgi:ATP-dependent Clp protease ATP-binding subunit ClpC
LEHPTFQEGVDLLLRDELFSEQQLLDYYGGDNALIACMALEALSGLESELDIKGRLLAHINEFVPWTRFFTLRALSSRYTPKEPLITEVLLRIDLSWHEVFTFQFLRDFLNERIEKGEARVFGDRLEGIPEPQAEFLESMLTRLGPEISGPLLDELREWRRTRIDFDFLGSIGKVWDPDEALHALLVEHDAQVQSLAKLEAALEKKPPRSILLVGESGVGKTSLIRFLGRRLRNRGWVVFEAGHNELLAGQTYIGELEARLKSLLERLGGGRRVLWFVPDFHALQWTGQHRHSKFSVLDSLIPEMEKGSLVIVGETRPGAAESLVVSKPPILRAMDVVRVDPLSRKQTLELARRWVAQVGTEKPIASDEVIEEAWQLSEQYLGDRAAPGNLIGLFLRTVQRLTATEEGRGGPLSITVDDLIETLTHLTGLPASILDERLNLDLEELRAFFLARVMGQQEAVDCLVERVAMIKAGLTDPTRPQGVFLFAGPTGTGKTEIAKALAEYLFGSPNRLIRLDMSEFQTPESLGRIMGEPGGSMEGSLVGLIRRQPFSVVLLDEFEKAHPNVWDLFLQVYDDGRLTDRQGNTADFRHAVLIMTSNLGGVIPTGTSLGFARETGRFSPGSVERAIQRTFRKEFLNRIDRIIVFHSLPRETMRQILRKELEDVLTRRGLRRRSWAVEWDGTAIEFLLEQGFTSDLGARPLKRAIERHLLSKLAMAIVNHQYPQGDQFLFVRSDGRALQVEFVDPDAPDEEPEEARTVAAAGEAPGPSRVEEVALDPLGTAQEIALLRTCYETLEEQVQAAEWRQAKEDSLAMTSEPGFWEDPNRFSVLGRVELLDRIDSGLASAGSLLARLEGGERGRRDRFSANLVKSLAMRLYLIERACTGFLAGRAQDAFLLIESGAEEVLSDPEDGPFPGMLAQMYRNWASGRGMKTETLEKRGGEEGGLSRLLLSVSGYGAYPILSGEDGLHVLERPVTKGRASSFDRIKVRVRVVPQPDEPAGITHATPLEQARSALAAGGAGQLVVVRRYRSEPSPLVRDSSGGWRTGHLDRVLAGDFDLIAFGKK